MTHSMKKIVVGSLMIVTLAMLSVYVLKQPEQVSDSIADSQSVQTMTVATGTITSPLKARTSSPVTSVPDFTQYADVKEKKQAFFDFLYPIVVEQNTFIREQRAQVKRIKSRFEQQETLSEKDTQLLMSYAKAYHIDEQPISDDFFNLLLRRVDVIPASLALAQAAIESGWGGSRFAQQGNNLFGHWCFSKGCGFVPASRDGNKSHEVAKFQTVNEAVRKYMRNLNAFHPYTPMRDIRVEKRNDDEPITGPALVDGLIDYSEMKEEYTQKVIQMIRQNKLTRYDVGQPQVGL